MTVATLTMVSIGIVVVVVAVAAVVVRTVIVEGSAALGVDLTGDDEQ